VTTEAIAILMGDLSGRREWLEEVAGLGDEQGAAIADRLSLARAASLLVFTRWVLVMTNFERAFYADPERDLDSLWWELVAKYQLVTPVEGRRAPDWAAKLHIALAPVYYHTYLYGQIVALQLAEALGREAGGIVDRPEAGRFLSERVFEVGKAKRWDRIVEQATGSQLSVASLAAAVG
jgi:peptidyl-dipeptidase A